jgi:hypothetical protein
MASLLAARRQHPAAALRLHAYAEAVRLGAAAAARLKCALWQNNPPLKIRNRSVFCITRKADRLTAVRSPEQLTAVRSSVHRLASSAAGFEFLSVFDPRAQGQEMTGVGYGEGKSDTPPRLILRAIAPLKPIVSFSETTFFPGWRLFQTPKQAWLNVAGWSTKILNSSDRRFSRPNEDLVSGGYNLTCPALTLEPLC